MIAWLCRILADFAHCPVCAECGLIEWDTSPGRAYRLGWRLMSDDENAEVILCPGCADD